MLEQRYAQGIVKEIKQLEVDGKRRTVRDNAIGKRMWELSSKHEWDLNKQKTKREYSRKGQPNANSPSCPTANGSGQDFKMAVTQGENGDQRVDTGEVRSQDVTGPPFYIHKLFYTHNSDG